MNCEAIIERLPWLLNGSLEPAEAKQVEEHLQTCADCRVELAAVRQVAADTSSHPSAEVITEYALGHPIEALPREVLESHLAHCESCSREVALVTGTATQPADAPVINTQRNFSWMPLAVAASLVALVLSSALIWQQLRPAVPVANVAVIELLPAGDRVRGNAEESTSVTKGPLTALLLVVGDSAPEDASTGDHQAAVTTTDGRVLLTIRGLSRNERGDFSLLLPTAQLTPGPVELRLSDATGRTVATYRLKLVD